MTERPDQPTAHLVPEAASAALDGEATPTEAAHLAGCGACQAEVATLRRVQEALATAPPRVPAVVREAALAAALDAFDEPGATAQGAARTTVTGHDELAARRGRRLPLGPLLGVAALVLLAVLAVPLLSGLGGDGGGDDMTAADGDATEEAEQGATALAAPDAEFTDVGDLGVLDPGTDLRSVVDGALAERSMAQTSGGEAVAGDDSVAGDAQAEGDLGAQDEAESSVSGLDAGTDQPSRLVAEACIEPVRAELGALGPLVLAGTASVDGEPALVLGFDAADAERPTTLVVLVVAETCRLVTFQSYAR